MSVTIRAMTVAELETVRQWSIASQAEELMAENRLCREAAIREAAEEFAAMLPHGLHTANTYLMTILAQEKPVGFLWTLHEETAGRKQSFLCDFAIWKSHRRKGYASAALTLAEATAAAAGCVESVLFVSNSNIAAKALYEKCGYRAFRQAGHGMYMMKQL